MDTSINERIKQIRAELHISQKNFADSMGLTRDMISNIELGRVDVKDYTVKLICKTYRVSYFWLTEGIGEPYMGVPEIIIDEAVEEYGLDELDKTIIEEYVKLDPATRNAVKNYFKSVFKNAPD